ncbi:MAG: MFS transporter [Hyphomicrobiales bacterium]|nr:MFS transporter [Hyphomicrobiales bacterium]
MTSPISPLKNRWAAVALCVAINACVTSAMAAFTPILLTVYLNASYFAASLFMIVATLAASAAIHVLGKVGDVPQRRYPILIVSALCGVAGALALTLATSYSSALLVFVTLFAVAGSLFPQLMALAFVYDRKSAPIIRAVASCGWVVGPPVGGLIVTLQSPTAIFYAIAAAYGLLLFALSLMALLLPNAEGRSTNVEASAAASHEVRQGSLSTLILVLATVHFLIAICALGVPWRIVELGGTQSDVGVAFAIAAAVEIPIIACAGFLRRRVGPAQMIVAACFTLALYFLAASLAPGPIGMIVVSFFNGAATGTMMGLSLIVIQDRLPDRPGYASSIYSNMLRLSYVAALLAGGGIAQTISVAAIFWVAAATALCLCLGLIVWRPLGPIGSLSSSRAKRGDREIKASAD